MTDPSLKPLSDSDLVTPREQALLGQWRSARWAFDPSSNRWCVLVRGEQVETARQLMSKLKQADVIHAFSLEDANRGVNVSDSSLCSGILTMDQESLLNLDIQVGQAADVKRRTARKPAVVLR